MAEAEYSLDSDCIYYGRLYGGLSILVRNAINNFSEVSSYGCIGLEYLDIAKGKRDFAIISKISPWDHIAGILITRESGAFDQYFDNGSYNFQLVKNNLVVASNKILGNKILSLIME